MKNINLSLKTIFIAVLGMVMLSACTQHPSKNIEMTLRNPPSPNASSLVICTSKIDNSVVKYYSNQDTPKPSTFLPGVTIHYIIETNGQHITLNSFELKNYKCVLQNNK